MQGLHVLTGDLDPVVLLDDLRELDEVERVDVELLPGGLAADRGRIGAELDQRAGQTGLDLLGGDGGGHVRFSLFRGCGQALSPPSTTSVAPVTYEASSEARKRMQAATSSGVPARRAGMRSVAPSMTSAVIAVAM